MELSTAQKALLYIIAMKIKASPGEVYDECNKLLIKIGYDPLSTRRLASLLADLELYGFVTKEIRGREWSVRLNDTLDRLLVLETLKKELFTSYL